MKKLIPCLLLTAVVFVTCSTEKKIKLINKNFEEEIQVRSLLSFTFDKEMVPDSLVGVWTEKQYISFEPAVEGKFHWQTTSKLVFAPSKEFGAASQYSAKLTDEVFRYTKLPFTGEKQFSFHTPYLKLLTSRAIWDVSEKNGEHIIKLELSFNYPVIPSELDDLLTVLISKEETAYRIETGDIQDQVTVIVEEVKKEDKDYPVEITINKGLAPYNGIIKTSEAFNEKFSIPSPFKLEISDMQSAHDGTEGSVTFYTTQKVDESEIRRYISISPSIRYKVDIQPGYLLVSSENFNLENKYEITVKKGLMGTLGGELKYDYTQPVSFGNVQPTIRFTDQKEFYVSGRGSRNIQAAIINVPDVKIKVTKLYENNILSYLRNNNYYYYDYDYEYDYYYNYNDPGNMGDVVYEKDVATNTLPHKGSNRILTLDFEDKLGSHPGIYVLEVRSDEDYWLRATKMISISDIGLIVKEGKNSITVFANSIKTAQPLANVTLRFIGNNNQVNHTLKTNSEGIAVYTNENLLAPGFKTSLISAQLENDFNVLPLSKTRINTSRFDVGGKRQNPSGLEAFIYGDRDLYRPGESINISAIIRDYDWNTPGDNPLILRLKTPNGKTHTSVRKVLNDQGSFETKINLSPSAQTGSYVAYVFTTNEVLIGSKVIKVEEFMPDRIKVDLQVDKTEYKPGETIAIDLSAENFFGPPAANRNYQIELSTKQSSFYPAKNKEYSYFIHGTHSSFRNILRESTTNAEGKAHEEFDIPIEYKNMGVLKSDIFSTVFDETGRPVNRLERLTIYTQDVFYGISTEDYYVKTQAPARFKLIAVDKDGNALEGIEAQVKLIRHEYKTVLQKSGGYYKYKSEKVEKVLKDEKITLNEKNTIFTFSPDLSGRYELRVSAPGVNTFVQQRLYAYGWGSTSYSSFKVNNEGQIDIELDKKKYLVGETANVLLKTPFSGKVLVTVETDKVLDYFYVETDKRAATFTLDIKEDYLPGVYIGATLFKPHTESDIPLTVAHGYSSVKVDNPAYMLPLEISAVEKSRSNSTQVIQVKSNPNTKLTIAVVDEGILQVAGFKTPDPYNFYYEKRALEVNTSNVYPYLFPEVGMIRSTTGGDGSEMAKRVNPMQNNRVKLVSFWSGIIETDNKGEAEYAIDIPQFSGDLRIMAVGYSGNIFGSAQKNMKVADPLVTSVALPRFLSPGDKVIVPVTLTNTTNMEAKCRTEIKLEGPLRLAGEPGNSVTILPNAEAELVFNLEALQEIGSSSVIIESKALGETFIHKTDITVRPASPLQKRTGSGFVEAGKTEAFSVNIEDFIASSVSGKLLLSKNPMIRYAKSLDYLVRYPYGCVEQTTSAAFPQIYFADIVSSLYSGDKASRDAVRNVQVALDRIKLMQLYNGGLSYWPGHGYQNWWASVYAAHFTIEAEKAGYEVDPLFRNALLRYLKKRLENKELIDYYYNGTRQRKIAPKEVAYSLYVLALAGEKPTSLMNYYRSRIEQLSLDSRYLLAGAYALSGDMRKAKEILPKAFEGEIANTSFGGSFYSAYRDESIALNVLLEIDSDDPQIGAMVKHVSEGLLTSRYLNTQERSFGFLAMGKFSKSIEGSTVTGRLKANEKEFGKFSGDDLSLDLTHLADKKLELLTAGSGKLFYFWESEGISRDGSYIEEDNYIKVRRNFYDRNGSGVSGNTFKQNDLVLVELIVSGLTDKYVENVAITDIIPACFEIENPRLTDLPPGMRYPHAKHTPDYIDMRDDRINMFATVSRGSRYYYYLIRVVSPGTYNMGPVSADAMYNGEYHSYHGAGKIVITRE